MEYSQHNKEIGCEQSSRNKSHTEVLRHLKLSLNNRNVSMQSRASHALRNTTHNEILQNVRHSLKHRNASKQVRVPPSQENEELSNDYTNITDRIQHPFSHNRCMLSVSCQQEKLGMSGHIEDLVKLQVAFFEEQYDYLGEDWQTADLSDESCEEIQHSTILVPNRCYRKVITDRNTLSINSTEELDTYLRYLVFERLDEEYRSFKHSHHQLQRSMLQIEQLQEASASFSDNYEQVKREHHSPFDLHQDENELQKASSKNNFQEENKALKAANEVLNERYQERINLLQEEINSFKETTNELERKNSQQAKMVEELNCILKETLDRTELAEAKVKLEKFQCMERSKQKSEINQLQNENMVLIEKNEEQKQKEDVQITELKETIALYEEKQACVRKKEMENEQLKAGRERLGIVSQQLEQSIKNANDLQQRLSEAQNKFECTLCKERSKYQSEFHQLKSENNVLIEKTEKLKQKHESQITELKDTIGRVSQELKKSHQNATDLQQCLSEAQNKFESTLCKERSKYQSEVHQLQSENNVLTEKTEKHKQEFEGQIKELKSTIAQYEEKQTNARKKEMEHEEQLKAGTERFRIVSEQLDKSLKKATELQQRLSEAENAQNEHQKIVSDLLMQQEKYKTDLEAVRNLSESVAKERDAKSKELAATQYDVERIKRDCDTKIKDLSDRLSAEMSKKVSTDESNLENVGVKNRPMNIATEYELLCSNQWLVAKTHVDDVYPSTPEQTKLNFLCKILVDSENIAKQYQKQVMNSVYEILINPFPIEKMKGSSNTREITQEMHVFVTDFLRTKADSADQTHLVKQMQQSICSGETEFKDIEQEGLHEYIQGCTKLTWKMALQRPPMTFLMCSVGQPWAGPDYDELFWSSSDPANSKSKVKCCVLPRLYHGEALMVKGKAYLAME